jgi:hypothetical protein
MFNNSFPKIARLWDNVEKHGKAWQATDENIRRVRFALSMTHSKQYKRTFARLKRLGERVPMLRIYVT